MKYLKRVDSQVIQSLNEAVALGRYVRLSAASQLPSGISWEGKTCIAIVIAASSYNGENLPGVLSNRTPVGNVYLVKPFRADPSPKTSPHWNEDHHLYFSDASGNAWKLHSKNSPDHCKFITAGSGLNELIRDYNLTSASRGSIDEYRQHRAKLDFEGPFDY